MATPNPTEVAPWYLRNINQALALNETTGNVYVRTDSQLTIGNVGNVSVSDVSISELGNVDITGNTLPVTVSGGNITVQQGTTPWTVTGNVGVSGTANVNLSGTNLDAFGRLRVSNPVTLFDSQNRYLPGKQFSNVTATGGSVTFVSNESSFNLAVTTANGSSAIQQAKFVQPYQPGKSMLVMQSFCMNTLIANCRQRVGYFTIDNGIYFEADGTTLNLVIRSSTSGSIVEERIPQSSWNGNRLNGTTNASNPLGITLNPALTNIFWCDIEWLGVGNVRAGFIINGQFIVCHTFQHANQPGNTVVYMTTATLNPRYEITNVGTTGSTATLKQICSTVISEGGYTPATTENYVSSGIAPTRVAVGNAYVALASIRLNPAYPDAVVLPSQLDLLLTDVQYGQYQLVLNASNVVANTGSWSNVTNSVVQTNTSALQIGDGTVLFGGVTSSRDTLVVTNDVKARLQLSRQANGTPDILTLCVGYGNPNADIIWRFGWEEITN